MTEKILLVTRPEHDKVSYYTSLWAGKVINEAEKCVIEVIDLRKENASKKTFESYTEKKKPDIFFFNGHGDKKTICGHGNKAILKKGDNEGMTKNGIVYARTCESACELGPSCVKKGTKAFIGYDKPFIFFTNKNKESKPLQDKVAGIVLECSNQVVKSVIKNKFPKEAYNDSQEMYKEHMEKVLSDPYYSMESFQLFVCLSYNAKSQTIIS